MESGKIQPSSLLSLKFPSDISISPNGKNLAFIIGRIEEENPSKIDPDWAKPRYRKNLWIASEDGMQQFSYTETGKGDSSPKWSPDGKNLVFIRGKGSGELMLIPATGGEARRINDDKSPVASLIGFSPDGRYIAFMSIGEGQDKRDERGEARVTEKPFYRSDGVKWLPEQPAGLWLYEVSSGEIKLWHEPERGMSGVVWLPDSSGVMYVSGSESACKPREAEVYELLLGSELRQVTHWGAPIYSVTPHLGTNKFAIVAVEKSRKDSPALANIYLLDRFSDECTRLDKGHDHAPLNLVASDCHVGNFPEKPVWISENTLLFCSTLGGSCGLFTADLAGNVSPYYYDQGAVISAFSANSNGVAVIRETPVQYPEIELSGKKISAFTEELPFTPVQPERLSFTNELGECEGWVMLPPHQSGKIPALLSIHGGPHTDYGYGFMHEFQVIASQGYAVCYSNPRGSVGYGQGWMSAIYGKWGGVDKQDLLNFFDLCLNKYPQLDSDKTAVMGGSYGGYMTNLITTSTTRFKAAITDRSICNLISFCGTSDIGLYFFKLELGLGISDAGDALNLWEMSPLKHVSNVSTPTLIIHSEQDYRCPVEQAEQWYAALKLQEVPTRFVCFPGENHNLSRSGRPDRRIRRLEEYLSWLDVWIMRSGD